MEVLQFLPFIWIGIAVFLALIELSTNQLVSIWFVIGAVVSAITAVFTDNLLIQIMVFIAVSALCLILTRPLVKKVVHTKKISTNADSLIGETGIVTIDIDNTAVKGQVNVNGQIWSAKSSDGAVISVGEKIKVLEITGVKLVVTSDSNN